MTEIPEHLLKRSRDARSRLTGVPADDAPAATGDAPAAAATAAAAAPAVRAPVAIPAAAPPPEAQPPSEWVQAATTRKKIPMWVMPVLLFLPVWLVMYVGTLSEPEREEGVLYEGSVVFVEHGCSGCHGAGGAGGTGPAFANGAVAETFATASSQMAWVTHGSQGYLDAGLDAYGTSQRPVGDHNGSQMNGFGDELTAEELMWVVFYERIELGGHEEDTALAEKLFDMAEHGELEGILPEHFTQGVDGDFTGDGEIGAVIAAAEAALGGEGDGETATE